MFFALPARLALLLWLATCAAIGRLVGWPVVVVSLAVAIVPTYLSIPTRTYVVAFPFAASGALVGALAFTSHGVFMSILASVLTAFVVGLGLLSAAMWLRHWRELKGRSA